jgi:hypothetical protein
VTIAEALTYNETLFKCFQFFIFHIDFRNDIGPAFQVAMSRIRQNSFPENTFDRFGHINMKILVKTFGWMSLFGQNSFPENTFA